MAQAEPAQPRQVTAWRQGHVLTPEAVRKFGLGNGSASDCVMVISHDCDLVAAAEPSVEVLVGTWTDKAEGNFRHAKSTRSLQLEATRHGQPALINLSIKDRCFLAKESLLADFEPEASASINGENVMTLQRWLALRYSRSSFPDEFVTRMNACEEPLTKMMRTRGTAITAVCFNLDRGENVERTDGSVYELQIVLLYRPGEDGDAVATQADALAGELTTLFEKHYFSTDGGWKRIELTDCFAVSEEEMRVGEYRRLREWRLEHVTLRGQDKHTPAAAAPPG